MHFASSYTVVDYTSESDCLDPDCGHLDGDYCRSSTITNVHVESVDLVQLAAQLVPAHMTKLTQRGRPERIFPNSLDAYIVGRLGAAYQVWQDEYWDFDIVGGYYGEEVAGTTFSHPAYEAALKTFATHTSRPAGRTARMHQALVAEYGSVLDSLSDCIYEVSTVRRSAIVVGRPDYYAQLAAIASPTFQDPALPLCLVQETPGGLRLIDGYHRLVDFDASAAHRLSLTTTMDPAPAPPKRRSASERDATDPKLTVVVARHRSD